jgi:methyl-accepting chemotaxis protein
MSLAKTMDELERHIDYTSSYFGDIKSKIEDLETNYLTEIANYIDQIDTLGEQNELLEEQVGEITHEKVLLELELTEVTNELIKLRHELDI